MKCPACGAAASGKFCMECGAAVAGQPCPSCEAPSQPGASFCIHCGAALGRRRGRAPAAFGAKGGWWVAWGLLGGVAIFMGLRVVMNDGPAPAPAIGPGNLTPGAASGASSVDLSTMTPREAADRLFDRVMRTASAGDTTGALNFLPMAIGAYELVDPLDPDGHYHISLLHGVGSDHRAALDTAERALEETPNHLLLLGAAASAASGIGDESLAAQYHQRLLAAWDAEQVRALEEYRAHSVPLAEMRQASEAAGGG